MYQPQELPENRRLLGATRALGAVALVLLLGTGAACSSDAEEPDTSTTTVDAEGGTSTTADAADTSTTSADGDDGTTTTVSENANDVGTDEGSSEVTAYCDQVDEVATLMDEMRADPTPDAVNAINEQLNELTQSATQLLEDHPDEVDRINSCAEALLGTP